MKETFITVASIFGVFAACVLVVTGLAYLYSWLRKKDQGYPYEALVEAAVLPYIHKAILAAYKGSELVFDETGTRLRGIDKAALARAVFGLLPPEISFNIGGYQVRIPIKAYFTEEQFAALIQRTFDEFLMFYEKNFDRWADMIQDQLGD